ncbi:GldG family protein [Paenibacillus marinisediminis]
MKKRLRGINSLVFSVAVIGIFIVTTIFLGSLSGFQWDLTKNKSFTLSEQTLTTLQNLDEDITMKLFMSSAEDPMLTREVEDIAQQYAQASNKIKYEKYDLYQEPSLAKKYQLSSSSIVFERGDKRNVIGLYEMFNLGQAPGEYQFTGEEKMTAAIQSLVDDKVTKGYVLTGHEEAPLQQMSVFASSLAQENVELSELNLYEEGAIPKDADAIFLLGANQDISSKELAVLEEYVKGDGKLYISLGFNEDMANAWPNLSSLLRTLGVQYEPAVVVEPKKSILHDPFTIVPEYAGHDITAKLEEYQKVSLLSLAVPLKKVEGEGAAYNVEPIMKTTDKAYGETDLKSLMTGEGSANDDKDLQGPFNLGYAVSTTDGKPKAVVMGSVTNLLNDDIYTQGNRDFALNSVAWLQEKDNQVTIRPRQNDAYQLAYLTPTQASWILTTTVVLFPLVLLMIGAVLWWRRRKG